MSALFETVAVVAPLVILGVLAITASFIVWQASSVNDTVFLGEMLARQGPNALRMAAASGSRDFACAIGRCTSCGATAQCRAWLDSGAREGFDEFCPNAGYVERIRALT